MDQRGIAGRQFASELADVKRRLDRLEKAKRGRVGNAGGKDALTTRSTISKENMIDTFTLMNMPYDTRDAIEILWYVVKGA